MEGEVVVGVQVEVVEVGLVEPHSGVEVMEVGAWKRSPTLRLEVEEEEGH